MDADDSSDLLMQLDVKLYVLSDFIWSIDMWSVEAWEARDYACMLLFPDK